MHNTYFFVLGKNPALSTAEILNILKRENIDYQLVSVSSQILLISTPQEFESIFIRTLGGTVKFGMIISSSNLSESEDKFFDIFSFPNLSRKFFPHVNKKIHFGLSIYSLNSVNDLKNPLKLLMQIGKLIKENLRQNGKSSGFVRIQERSLSSVSVAKNNLLNDGAEIILISDNEKIYVGKTLAVQEFEEYSSRDYGRPQRDLKRGLLPPKVAKMMLNLTLQKKDSIILDPFCGSGTIIQEAILLGFRHLIGADIEKEAINQTRKNIDWLTQNQNISKENFTLKLYTQDVKYIDRVIDGNSIDAVVTEPYLGPLFHRPAQKHEVINIIHQLSALYIDAFKSFAEILKKEKEIVIIFPVFSTTDDMMNINILSEIENLGFILISLLPPEFEGKFKEYTKRHSIIYGTPEHFVKREILKFKKI